MKLNLPFTDGVVIVLRQPIVKEDEHGNRTRGYLNGLFYSKLNKSRNDTYFTPVQ